MKLEDPILFDEMMPNEIETHHRWANMIVEYAKKTNQNVNVNTSD